MSGKSRLTVFSCQLLLTTIIFCDRRQADFIPKQAGTILINQSISIMPNLIQLLLGRLKMVLSIYAIPCNTHTPTSSGL